MFIDFFDYLDEYMCNQNMKQTEFCKTFEISYKWFNNKMRNRPDNLGTEVLCKIATKLNVSIIDMFVYEKQKNLILVD